MALAAACSAADGTLDPFAMEPEAAPDGAEGVIAIGMPTAADVFAAPCSAADTTVDSFDAMEAAAAPDGAEGVIAVSMPITATDIRGA